MAIAHGPVMHMVQYQPVINPITGLQHVKDNQPKPPIASCCGHDILDPEWIGNRMMAETALCDPCRRYIERHKVVNVLICQDSANYEGIQAK